MKAGTSLGLQSLALVAGVLRETEALFRGMTRAGATGTSGLAA